MKNHIAHAPMTETRLLEMVLMSVLRRLGAWSTQRPTAEEKHIEARVLTMPLRDTSVSIETSEQAALRGKWFGAT